MSHPVPESESTQQRPGQGGLLPIPLLGPPVHVQVGPVPPGLRLPKETEYTYEQYKKLDLNVSLSQTAEVVAEPKISLSAEQKAVLDIVKSGKNIFFTGAAGTGKSVVLREIIKWCKEQYKPVHHRDDVPVAITASTGIAGVNIGGCTVHSWAGIGLGEFPAYILLRDIFGWHPEKRKKDKEWFARMGQKWDKSWDKKEWWPKPKLAHRWTSCKVLIIDEISMISGELFDKLDYLARNIRDNNLPFGGIQLVICGDFLQLPPIPRKDDNDVQLPAVLAFEAKAWCRCVGQPVILKQVFRQKDQAFVKMLNALRKGHVDMETDWNIKRLSREIVYTDGIDPTQLFTTRAKTDALNCSRLDNLPVTEFVYEAHEFPGDEADGKPVSRDKMKKLLLNVMVPQDLTLKVGAQVMLIRNLVQGLLVNGTIGQVMAFKTVRDAMQSTLCHLGFVSRLQRPAPGMPYWKTLKLEAALRDEYERIMRDPRPWPLVRFVTRGVSINVICLPDKFEVNSATGSVRATREQVPLILAWAFTVHKSQGQTIERVKIDLSNTFEKGQVYVALSRATSMETLEVSNFEASKVKAHPLVLQWMNDMEDDERYEEYEMWSQLDNDSGFAEPLDSD